jgi:hypothetical protein
MVTSEMGLKFLVINLLGGEQIKILGDTVKQAVTNSAQRC